MRFHVPSFFLLAEFPAIRFTAQDHPAIGSAATIRIMDANAVTVWSERILLIKYITFLRFYNMTRIPRR